MRLIIKDYLSCLREKDELDLLLCDLLLQMGYVTHNVPKTGNRQYGVDIRADNEKELLLFVIKQGDMNRTNWNCGQNAVRQSLDEIHDSYMGMINGNDRDKKLSIVVATNGVMDEAVRPNWEGYKRDNTLWGGISVEITFWDIDTITSHIQKSLFDEYLFGDEMRSLLRRALYYVEESDYRRVYYERLIDNYLSELDEKTSKRKREKILSGVFLATQMIAYYAANCGKYRIGIMVSEYLVIRYWKHLLEHKLLGKEYYVEWLHKYLAQYEKWNHKYYSAVKFCCEGKNRLLLNNPVEQRVILYEMLGYLTSYAYYLYFENHMKQGCADELSAVVNSIVQIFNHYPQVYYPPFDNHAGILTMLYRLFDRLDRTEEVIGLLNELCFYMQVSYRKFKKYPSPVDSFEDAVNIDMGYPAEEYNVSGFWGTMIEWIVLLDQKELYQKIQPFLSEDMSNVTKCGWFLKSEEEVKFYDANAMYSSGTGVAFESYDNFEKVKEEVNMIMNQFASETFSFEEYEFPALEFIVGRYYAMLPRVKKETKVE